MVYIRAHQLPRLKEYKYSGVDHSLVSRYVLKPFYTRFVIGLFPLWMARRTHQSGPLGELFDHGVDALNTTLEVLLFAASTNLGQSSSTFLTLFGCLLTFYVQTWEEYHTKTLYLGLVSGPVEGVLTLCGVFLVTAVYGGGHIWERSVLGTFGVERGEWGLPGWLWEVGWSLLPFVTTWSLAPLYLHLNPTVLDTQLLPLIFALGLQNALTVGLIITSHLTSSSFPLTFPMLLNLPLALGTLDGVLCEWLGWRSILGAGGDGFLFLWVWLGVLGGIYGGFVVDVVVSICDYLDIWCLTIKHPWVEEEEGKKERFSDKPPIQSRKPLLDDPPLLLLLLLLPLPEHPARPPNNQQPRGPAPQLLDSPADVLQRSPNDALIRTARALYHRARRGLGVPPAAVAIEQGGDEDGQAMQGHQEHDGAGLGIRGDVGQGAAAAGGGADEELVCDAAAGSGDGGDEQGAEGGADAGQDDGREAAGAEPQHLLCAAAEDVGVALLEAHDDAAGAQGGEAERQELRLGGVGVAGELARGVERGAAREEGEDRGGDELVGEDEVGGEEGAVGGGREEVGVAGAAAGEEDGAPTGHPLLDLRTAS
ncbi:hypothetical protein FGG08_001913, partial [Glutinoglossum americanum]